MSNRLEKNRKMREKEKLTVIEHYSNGTMKCSKCGFSDIRALSIDHVDGNGNQHRKQVTKGNAGWNFYRWLRLNNYPEGFQVLCMNCQFIKRVEEKEYKNKSDDK